MPKEYVENEEEQDDLLDSDWLPIGILEVEQDVASGMHMPKNMSRPDLGVDPRTDDFSKNASGLLDIPIGSRHGSNT